MSVFIFLFGGAYLLYKYVEEEKGKGPKGGYIAVAIAAAVLIFLTFVYRADPTFGLSDMGLIEYAFVCPLIIVGSGCIVGLILGLDDNAFLKDMFQAAPVIYGGMVLLYLVMFGFFSIFMH